MPTRTSPIEFAKLDTFPVVWMPDGHCTCSLEPEEGEQAIATLLATEPAMRRVPIEVAGLAETLTGDGDLRTLPCHLPHQDPRLGGLDGFYAARLVKS